MLFVCVLREDGLGDVARGEGKEGEERKGRETEREGMNSRGGGRRRDAGRLGEGGEKAECLTKGVAG